MKSCESYEMHISALMDGEASRGDMLAILDHLPSCASCQAFYRDCRELQDVADSMPVGAEADIVAFDGEQVEQQLESADERAVDAAAPTTDAANQNVVAFPRPSRWVWAVAASIALFVVAASVWMRPGVRTTLDAAPHVIDLSVQKPSEPMDDAQFMEISVALLHAEPRYQRTMIEILERFERSRGLDESSVDVAATESGEPWTTTEYDDSDSQRGPAAQPQP